MRVSASLIRLTVFVVVTFLALLELIKERVIRVQQASPLAPILVAAARAS